MKVQFEYTYEEYNKEHVISVEELKNMLSSQLDTLVKGKPFIINANEKNIIVGIVDNIEFDDTNSLIVIDTLTCFDCLSIEFNVLEGKGVDFFGVSWDLINRRGWDK